MRLNLILLLLVAWSIESNLITKQARLSSRRDAVGGIQVEELFYFVGGFEFNDYIPTNIIDIYNITSQEWEEPIYLEEPRGFVSTTVSGQNIYFVGGTLYHSCAMVYNTDIHQYEDIGCGPTVRSAAQISYHNDTLTVLGAFSADFFNASMQWYNIPHLTSWMQQIGKGALLVHENLIIGIGGVNTTTFEQIYDAWIFDTTTNDLTVFSNVTTVDMISAASGFTAAHGWIVIYFADRYFVHEFGTTEWHEVSMIAISEVVILTDVIFLVNATGSMIYDLTMKEQRWRGGNVNRVFDFDNQVVLYIGDTLIVYENAQLTTLQLDHPIRLAARWGDKYIFQLQNNSLQLYNSQSKTVSDLSLIIQDITSLIPFNETTFVIFLASSAQIYNMETQSTTIVNITMTNPFLINRDIVSFENRLAWINLNDTVGLTFTVINRLIEGPAIYGPQPQSYPYADVLNYVTREWQPRIPIPSGRLSLLSFSLAFIIDDVLIIGKRTLTFRYNLTTGETSLSELSKPWLVFQVVNSVPVLNHTGYTPGTGASMLIISNSTNDVIRDDLQLGGAPTQFVTYNNTIYSTIGPTFYSINTINILNGAVDTLVLPVSQYSVSLAVMNDTLVALGNGGSAYGLLLSDRLTWYQTPLQNKFIRTITVAMKDGTFMVAGGRHFQLGSFTDEILFINASAVIEMGSKISIKEPTSTQPGSDTPDIGTGYNGLTEGELAAAIVVPVVVVIGGVIALVVVLLKRRNTKKNSSSTALGLETRYGTWFIPFNQITFGEQLGQGSSGQVFKGTWKNTTVALKVSMTQANTTVISELELMMQLRPHPNVVQLLGFSVHPETDSIILIIEFCEGGSLDNKLYDSTGDISMTDKVQWLLGIAKGLSHLHANNIVHRDVAARNVLLDRNEPKLTDFGMSRLVDEQNQHGTTKSELGPIRWMSPESLRNKEYSTKSDIWSFGVLMYEVIARQEPHSDTAHNADPIEIGRLIRDTGLTPVIPTTCHPQLAEIMKQCWQMSSQLRPKIESVVQMLESLAAE